MPAPSTSTISSSEAICDTPRPCTAASAVSRSATSTTTTAGSTAISGASADRNTATSSAITKMMENHWTWPPVLPEVALVSTRVATVPAVRTARPPGGPAARMASRTPATSVACWEVARPPDWASAASTVSWSACPSADWPASRTAVTRATRDSEPASRATNVPSAAESGPPARAATTVTAVSEAPCSGEASSAACSLGALAGRNEVLSLCVTLDSDGSSTMAAAVPAAQARTMTQRKRTASRPAAVKNVPTKPSWPAGGRAREPKIGSVADPLGFRPAPGEIPESPGVYKFRDQRGRVIYVGKAKSLRQRLNQYFADFASLHPRTQMMLTTAAGVEWTVVGTEVEALQLEYSWIKEYDPRFNIKYRDDKSYPYLAVTMSDEYPRVMVMRGAKRKGTRYFGPYSHAWAIRDTVDTLLRVFPVRTCSAGVFKRSGQIGRPCLLGYIGKCSAPCVKRVSAEEHRALAEDFCDFMAGQTSRFAGRLEAEMKQAAREEEFERAARLRDDLRALERAIEKQAVVLGDGTDCDVIALAEDQLEAAVQVFYVRGGRVRGQRGWVLDKIEEVTPAGLVEQFLGQVYADAARPGPRRSTPASRGRSWSPSCRRTRPP